MLKVKWYIRWNLLFWSYYLGKSEIHNLSEESSINEKDHIFMKRTQEKGIGLFFTYYFIVLKVKWYIRLNLLFWNYYSEKSEIHNL